MPVGGDRTIKTPLGRTTRAAIPLRLAASAYPYIVHTQRSVTSLSVVKCDVGHIAGLLIGFSRRNFLRWTAVIDLSPESGRRTIVGTPMVGYRRSRYIRGEVFMTDSSEPHRQGDPPVPATVPSSIAAEVTPPTIGLTEPSVPRVHRGHRAGPGHVAPNAAVQFGDRSTRSSKEWADSRRRRGRRRRRRRTVAGIMLGAGALVLAGSLWVGWRSYQAYSHLQTAAAEVTTLQGQIEDITAVDRVATSATVERLAGEAAAARSAVDDPVFRSATLLPFIGPNLAAIRDIAVTVDSLAADVMPSLIDAAETLQASQLAPANDSIDLAPIERISPSLQNADAVVHQSRVTMAAIDRTAVLQPIGAAVLTLRGKLDQAAEVTEPGARIARLLPPMLGSVAPRTYLVVFQNPAEPRATGGIFGSFAVISADRGKVSILEQGSASRTLGQFDPPLGDLTRKEQNLYGAEMGRFPQDVNFSPDFPTAANIFAEMYRQRSGTTVDGVLAHRPGRPVLHARREPAHRRRRRRADHLGQSGAGAALHGV